MSTQPIIQIKNINHYYGKGQLRKQILFDISLKISPGEIDRVTGYHTRNILCLPMFNSKNRVFAVVLLTNKLGDTSFDANDESQFCELTTPLSVILEGSLSVLEQYRSRVIQNLQL